MQLKYPGHIFLVLYLLCKRCSDDWGHWNQLLTLVAYLESKKERQYDVFMTFLMLTPCILCIHALVTFKPHFLFLRVLDCVHVKHKNIRNTKNNASVAKNTDPHMFSIHISLKARTNFISLALLLIVEFKTGSHKNLRIGSSAVCLSPVAGITFLKYIPAQTPSLTRVITDYNYLHPASCALKLSIKLNLFYLSLQKEE